VGLAVSLIAICFVPLAGSRFCQERAIAAMSARKYQQAGEYLNSARLFQVQLGRTEFLHARLDRKRGRFESMRRRLDRCRTLSVSTDKIEREFLLAEAQAGVLIHIQPVLPELLTDPQGDLQEICAAYVNGCIADYRLPEAVQVVESWIADFPDDPEPHYLLGRICEHTGKYGRAEEEYRTAIELGAPHAPAACNLGRLLLHELDRPADALVEYELAAQNLEQPQPALCGAALCLRRLERLDEARRRLDEALALPGDNIEEAYRLVGEPAESAAAQIPAVCRLRAVGTRGRESGSGRGLVAAGGGEEPA
jgi:tetratricopeptide (TPR) repeat protein